MAHGHMVLRAPARRRHPQGDRGPPSGGDTYFLSTYQAFETLPEELRRAVEGRQIFFQNVYDKTGKLRLGKGEPTSADFREWSGVVHPLVRTHGETGRKALYLGGTSEGRGSSAYRSMKATT